MYKREEAFTLIEMLIVLLIVSILILLIVPHVSKKAANIHDKGCEALVELVQSQVVAYELDHHRLPSNLNILVNEQYIEREHLSCGNGKSIVMNSKGVVSYE